MRWRCCSATSRKRGVSSRGVVWREAGRHAHVLRAARPARHRSARGWDSRDAGLLRQRRERSHSTSRTWAGSGPPSRFTVLAPRSSRAFAALRRQARSGRRAKECERGDSNPHSLFAYRILSPARLPVPPLSRDSTRQSYATTRALNPFSITVFASRGCDGRSTVSRLATRPTTIP